MDQQSNEQTELLREILKWVRFAGLKEVKNTLESALDTEPKRITYYLSDGSRSTREIERITGVGRMTISRLWQVWLRSGLGDGLSEKGGNLRFKRAFNPVDFGINVPASASTPETSEGSAKEVEEANA